jgi:hypothetical protein
MKIFLTLNITLFICCYIDKKCAIKNKYRISENLFIFLSMLGGCFGFYLAMILFHHKTKKKKFKIIPLICIVWIIILLKLNF